MNEVKKFLDYLLSDRGYSAKTILTYKITLSSFEDFFHHLDETLTWQTIDADVVRLWMTKEAKDGEKARTIGKKLSAMRSFYKYMQRMDVIENSPLARIHNPKAASPLPTFLRKNEIDALFDKVIYPDGFKGLLDYTILQTFYHTGIRLSELIGLNIADVNIERCELKVTGKRNKQRIVPYGIELKDTLAIYLSSRQALTDVADSKAMFLGRTLKRITISQIRTIVNHYLSLVTMQKKKSPHVLRHTFATAMLNNGADLEAIKELLGHESITTTEIYTHNTFADLKKEYKLAHPRA